jgi:single-strand DNA-binding protein
MRGMNKVILCGNLGKAVELKYTTNGVPVASFSVACNESWKDERGEKQERVEWVRCVAWRGTAETAAEYLDKGSPVLIEGKMQTRDYEGSDGVKRWVTEVVVVGLTLLGGNKNGVPAPSDADTPAGKARSSEVPSPNSVPQGITDEDIPF